MGNSPTHGLKPEDYPDLGALRAAWTAHEAKIRSFLQGVDEQEIERVYEFKMLNGQEARGVFWHMLQHVVNHASYHRGQVTTMLRQLGAAPPKSQDLIAFYRERA